MPLFKDNTKTITFSCGRSKAIQGMKCFTCMAASASCSIPPLLHFIKTLHTHKTPQQHSLLIRHHLPLLSSTKLKPCCNHLQAFLTMTKLRLAFPQFKRSTAVHPGYLKEIERARRELRALISIEKCAPLMLRLAWHDAGTYEPETKTGGPNGSIRTDEELGRDENKGLQKAVELCEKVKVKCPKISYADLYQLAGVVAVEVTGGPTIDFVPGRQDSLEPSPAGRLPDANKGAKHLREVFYRMGLTDREIVALSGGHTLGQAHRDRSGFEFRWTKTPLKFDNSYFVELLKSKGETMLPTDKALVEDSLFIKYVELYSQDEEAFFTDYAAAHKKLSELGYNLKPVGEHRIAHGVIGIFIASTMVILGYLFEVNRRSK